MSSHHLPPLRLLLLTGAVMALALLSGCGRPGAGDAHAGNGPPPAPEVQVAEVALQAIRPWDEFNGRIEAVESVQLRSRVSGYIERIAFAEGQEVKKGQLLFVIDQRPYRAALASAQAQLERARAAAGLAQTQDQRARQLVAENAVSREEADTRAATLAQATAQVRAAEAELATARLQLDFTEVRAPITGRAGRALLTVGNLAQADQSLLTTVVSQDPVHVYFETDEQTWLRYARLARDGTRAASDNPVRVGLAGESGYPHAGTVDFVDNRVDPATGTIRARAVLRNPDGVFTPGLFARVQLEGSGRFDALLVDDKAVLTDQDRKYVYVLGKDNTAQRKDVVLGRVIDGLRVVESGLSPGDAVIVSGLQKVFMPGMPVAPKKVAMPSAQSGERVASTQ